jgi:hypothetical protein
MTTLSDRLDRFASSLPRPGFGHWLLRAPLALVLLQYGLDKYPLVPEAAAGFGVPLWAWALAGFGEIVTAILLLVGGVMVGARGDLVTRVAGYMAFVIVGAVVVVAYWAPPLDLLMFNQFHILLMATGLYLGFAGNAAGVTVLRLPRKLRPA